MKSSPRNACTCAAALPDQALTYGLESANGLLGELVFILHWRVMPPPSIRCLYPTSMYSKLIRKRLEITLPYLRVKFLLPVGQQSIFVANAGYKLVALD